MRLSLLVPLLLSGSVSATPLVLDALIASGKVAAAFSTRKLSTTYAGQCLRLRRSSDNAESDFGFVDNVLDVAAIATFIGGGSGFAVTWYDQSGNTRDVIQATTANQPLYVASGQNSKPVLRSDGTNDRMTKTSFPDFGDVYSVFTMTKFATGGDDSQGIFEVGTGAPLTGFTMLHSTAPSWRGRDSVNTKLVLGTDVRDSVGRIHKGINTGTQLEYTINATAFTPTAYTAPNANTLNQLDLFMQNTGWYLNGDIGEFIVCNTNLDSTEQDAITTDMGAYWAT